MYSILCVCLIKARVQFGVLIYYGVLFVIPFMCGFEHVDSRCGHVFIVYSSDLDIG